MIDQLTEAEVRALTGRVHRQKQMEWFTDRGVRCELGGDNRVKVLRAAVEQLMLPGQARPRRGPNLAALKKAS